MTKTMRMGVTMASLAVLSAGCQTGSQGSKTYTREQAQTPQAVYRGTVVSVADVTIETGETGVGAVAGGVVGGIVGSTIGGGRGRRLATTGGALGGAVAGSAAEKARGTRPGLELEVELEDGRTMVIVQEKDDEYAVGDRVRVVEAADGTMRVRH